MQVKPRNWAYMAIVLALLFHGALLPFTYGQTYDGYIHMFFADHYHRQWFDPWETKWYTGFMVTAYPPGSHQSVALLMNLLDMRAAFIVIMTGAVSVLTIGVYRFSRIWVDTEAAAFAALLCVFSTSISQTVHIFGQLPTIFSIAFFLNAMPHMAAWIEKGRWRELIFALMFTGGATSAHHVTPLFGTVFFVAPIGLAAWLAHLKNTKPKTEDKLSPRTKLLRLATAPGRGILLGGLMLLLIVTIVFPYWYWSITDPIKQVSIPHGSRESFLDRPNLGIMFFVIPWGLLVFTLPYVIYKTCRTALWPLGVAVLLAMLLGTGGTTPFPKMLLGPAFDILTLDRFTFWGSLLILPFGGLLAVSMIKGRIRQILDKAFGELAARLMVIGVFVTYALLPIAVTVLPKIRPTQPDYVEPAPIVKFMDDDGHSNWRYLTLGFGDQVAYHSALINAESVDGNYNSARRLPALTNYSVERLENSKFAGVPGLASLNQFLTNADKFHLKYTFSNDEYYDPLLHYTGWNPVTRLQNGVMVWEKANIPPLPDVRARRKLDRYQVMMWGTLPITAVGLSVLVLLWLAIRGQLISRHEDGYLKPRDNDSFTVPSWTLMILRIVPVLILGASVSMLVSIWGPKANITPKSKLVKTYYGHLDFREYEQAYALLDTELSYSDYLRSQRLRGGLLPSYGKLVFSSSGEVINQVQTSELVYLTALGYKKVLVDHDLTEQADGSYRIKYSSEDTTHSNGIVIRQTDIGFVDQSSRNVIKPEIEAVKKLQRPRLQVLDSYLYEKDSRFYVAGHLTNNSPFPACINLVATALDEDENEMISQNMGRVGAHRLLPGETSPYLVAFEGYLKIQDANFNSPYDPDYFSVPEFSNAPVTAKVEVQSTICSPDIYRNIRIANIEYSDNKIRLNIENSGLKIVSTLQLKIAVRDLETKNLYVVPFYLQENLNPGETRHIQVPMSKVLGHPISVTPEAIVNGLKTSSVNTRERAFTFDDWQIEIFYDAMTYDRLR